MMYVVLFGPPGSGKGTQAKILEEDLGLIHISSGDLFRSEIGNQTELGKLAQSYMKRGELVPDEITLGMLKNRLADLSGAIGCIFDGFPRTINQAETLDKFLKDRKEHIELLISLTVEDEEIVKRILERSKTSGRSDDADESVIRNRIKVYKETTAPVFEHYKNDDRAIEVAGVGTIEEISSRLKAVLEPKIKARDLV